MWEYCLYVMNPNRSDWAAGEVPERNCAHNNEKFIGRRGEFDQKRIKCVDCGSVRAPCTHTQGPDFGHEDTL